MNERLKYTLMVGGMVVSWSIFYAVSKIIVGAKYHEVLGVHMMGNPCSEIINAACIAIEQEMTLEQLKEVVFPHPTVSEIIKETAFTIK